MISLNNAVDGVACESKWVQETISIFFHVKSHYLGLSDTKHFQKEPIPKFCRIQFRSYRGYLLGPGIIHISNLPH